MNVDEKPFKYCFGNYLNKPVFAPELLGTDHDRHICLNDDSQPHGAVVNTVITPESASTLQIL
jgi:hypothetical protein